MPVGYPASPRVTNCSYSPIRVYSGRVRKSLAAGLFGFYPFLPSKAVIRITNREDSPPASDGNQCGRAIRDQLHPWLVPHSVQTPQAPARITLSLPQWEQMMSMNIDPSAS